MASADLTVEILKTIRSELRDFRGEQAEVNRRVERRLQVLDDRLELTNQRLDIGNRKLDVMEATLLTVARRQRGTVRLVHANAEGLSELAGRVTDLEARVGKLETR